MLLMALVLAIAVPAVAQSQQAGPQAKSELHLVWEGIPGINRYRLQVSTDAQFTDLVFDRAVEGHEFVISGLPLGHYYWRVAPAAGETGTFSNSRTVEIASVAKIDSTLNNTQTSNPKPPSKTGWSAATGTITQPLALFLRDQSAPDVVGVNSDGMVYALDATDGTALWTARFRPSAKRGEPTGNGGALPFQPLALGAAGGLQNVLVAFDDGVRAIEGVTGRELWRTHLTGRAASAAVGDLNGDGAMEVVVFQDNPLGLSILDARTGSFITQLKSELPEAAAVGAPLAVNSKTESGVLLALANGTLDLRNVKGEHIRSTKLDVQFTTPPIIVQTPQHTLAMVGTDHGLIAIDVATLKPLWRVATEGDAPRGQLVAADLDNDGTPEIVMITRRDRTVVVGTGNGKIKWYANIPNRAGTPILTDLNGDGLTDVLIASDSTNLLGHDGRSGALIFGNERGIVIPAGAVADEHATYQTCAYVPGRGNSGAAAFVVCNDPAGGGLRADGLPSGK